MRGAVTRVQVKERKDSFWFLAHFSAAVQIQCRVRRNIATRIMTTTRKRRRFARRQSATVDIQRLARGFLGRKRSSQLQLAREYHDKMEAATVIQSRIRGFLGRRQAQIVLEVRQAEELAANQDVCPNVQVFTWVTSFLIHHLYREQL